MECSDCTPIRKDRDEILQENRYLNIQLHKADLQIGRLRAEIRKLKNAPRKEGDGPTTKSSPFGHT